MEISRSSRFFSYQVISDEVAGLRRLDGSIVVVIKLLVEDPDRFEARLVLGEVVQVPVVGLERTLVHVGRCCWARDEDDEGREQREHFERFRPHFDLFCFNSKTNLTKQKFQQQQQQGCFFIFRFNLISLKNVLQPKKSLIRVENVASLKRDSKRASVTFSARD